MPKLSFEDLAKGSGVAQMDATQAAIAQERAAALLEATAKVHVLAGLQGGVEAVDGFEGVPPHGNIPCGKPPGRADSVFAVPEGVKAALDPCAWVRAFVLSARSACFGVVLEGLHDTLEPVVDN